jgi:SAM-dependent methyltransferase
MSKIVKECPLCGSEKNHLFDLREFHGQKVVNRICNACGLVFQSPRMDEAETASFYADEYRLLNEGSAGPTARNMSVQHARAEALAGFIGPFIYQLSRHLDVGCSTGILLEQFNGIYGCQPVGIEPGEAHRSQAQNDGLTVYASMEDLEKASEARFDLVSMSHVLEHLPEPVEYLTRLRESRLAPEGLLLLEVPNLYAHDSFEVAHLLAFSEHTLREVLRRSGFTVVKFKKHGIPSSALFPLFLTVVCHPLVRADTSSPIRPERLVALKRRMGMLWRQILARLFPKRAWLVQEA